MTDTLSALGWAKVTLELGTFLFSRARSLIDSKRNPRLQNDPFLIYDVDFLLTQYKDHTASPDIPYLEMANMLGKPDSCCEITIMRGDFKRDPGNNVWASISKNGFEALRQSRRIPANEPMIHLRSVSKEGNRIMLKVQQARYYDHAKSNLILDWPTQVNPRPVTLRDLLATKYHHKLPPLSDRRLANTVGVACLLFYAENHQIVPYLVRRVAQVGVYPGGIHCTASGAANWPTGSKKSFNDFFLSAMHQELEEEVGIRPADIVDLKAVSIGREFLRSGKPQIFFAGFTRLSRNELRHRRIRAADTIKQTNGWPEVERDNWLHSSDVVIPPDELRLRIEDLGITLEGIASYLYGTKYIEKYGQQLVQ